MVKLVPLRRKWRQKRWERGRNFSLKTKKRLCLGFPEHIIMASELFLPLSRPLPPPHQENNRTLEDQGCIMCLRLVFRGYSEHASLNTMEVIKSEPHACLEFESKKSARHQGKWQYHLFHFFEAKSPFPLWKLTLSALKVASLKLDLYHFSFQEGLWQQSVKFFLASRL